MSRHIQLVCLDRLARFLKRRGRCAGPSELQKLFRTTQHETWAVVEALSDEGLISDIRLAGECSYLVTADGYGVLARELRQ